METDIVVIGAGPGGTAAAYFLAQAGARVALLDKEIFPRNKTCSDCVSRRALAQLRSMGLGDWLDHGFHTPTGLRIIAPNGELAMLKIDRKPSRFGRLIPRRELDASLVERATTAGAHFMGGAHAMGLSVEDSCAVVHFMAGEKKQTIHCQIVIAADGSKGSFSQRVGLPQGPVGVAARVYTAGHDPYEEYFDWIYEPDTLPGYGWVFPMGNGMCNVGIGTPVRQSNTDNLRVRLLKFMASNSHVRDRLHDQEIIDEPRVAYLDWNFYPSRTWAHRLLAVGDAAGLVSPLTGSGISKALISGEVAAECAINALASGDPSPGSLAIYGNSLRALFGWRRAQLRILQALFKRERALNRMVDMLNHDQVASNLAKDILSGRTDYVSLLRPGIIVRLLV
jgi:geranylgeranyl reductase family protein